MRYLFAVLRLIVGAGALVAVVATFEGAVKPVNFFNFFGYFTIQSNIIVAIVFVVVGVVGLLGRAESPLMRWVRGAATTYIIIVGIVYNTLLVGQAGGVTVPWANVVLHVVLPIYALIDWVLFGDRPPLPWRCYWYIAIYPIVWCIVVLIRGATDGWVPYPFLNPHLGYGIVLLYVVGIAVAVLAVGCGVWALSRVRILKESGVGARS